MKTTLNIDDSVMQRLREAAAQSGTTMSALVEAGLRRVLAEPKLMDGLSGGLPPLPTWRSGGFQVDIADRDALYRAMEEKVVAQTSLACAVSASAGTTTSPPPPPGAPARGRR